MGPDPSRPTCKSRAQHRRQRQDVPQRPSGKEASTAKPAVDKSTSAGSSSGRCCGSAQVTVCHCSVGRQEPTRQNFEGSTESLAGQTQGAVSGGQGGSQSRWFVSLCAPSSVFTHGDHDMSCETLLRSESPSTGDCCGIGQARLRSVRSRRSFFDDRNILLNSSLSCNSSSRQLALSSDSSAFGEVSQKGFVIWTVWSFLVGHDPNVNSRIVHVALLCRWWWRIFGYVQVLREHFTVRALFSPMALTNHNTRSLIQDTVPARLFAHAIEHDHVACRDLCLFAERNLVSNLELSPQTRSRHQDTS